MFFVISLLFISSRTIAYASQRLGDPFYTPQLISCDELASQLILQLSKWQYKGQLYTSHNAFIPITIQDARSPDDTYIPKQNTLIVWLANEVEWIAISDLMTPVELIPWKIVAISEQKIDWQVSLPIYCEKQLDVVMEFKRE